MSSKIVLKNHVIRVHGKALENSYECKQCGKYLCSKNGYKNHMLIHADEFPFHCNICPKKFREKTALKTHFESQHINFEKLQCGSWKCQICQYSSMSSEEFFSHKCTVIAPNKVVIGKNQFKGIRSKYCEICNVILSSKKSFNTHMSMHKKHPYKKCPICGKEFKSMNHAFRHMEMHSKSKQLRSKTCAICSVEFQTISQTRLHIKTVHKGKIL